MLKECINSATQIPVNLLTKHNDSPNPDDNLNSIYIVANPQIIQGTNDPCKFTYYKLGHTFNNAITDTLTPSDTEV